MRSLLALLALLAAAIAGAQEPASLFRTLRADGTVVVRQHALGPQIVEVTMQDPKYPPELLERQVKDLAKRLGSEIRGLQVFRYKLWDTDPNPPLVKASFSVDGLEDPEKGVNRLEPIVQAFAGAPPPYTVNGLSVQFEKQTPGRNTLRRYRSEAIVVEASEQPDAHIGVEYRVQLLSQDPAALHIPERPEPARPASKPAPRSTFDPVTTGLVVIAALALGALVYSLLLRARPRSTPPKP